MFRWLKNGREITLGGRFRAEAINGIYRLVISEVWDADDGDYSCQISNPLGVAATTCRLKIGTPPRIERMPGDLYLPEATIRRSRSITVAISRWR